MGGDSTVTVRAGEDCAPLPRFSDIEPAADEVALELAVPPCRELEAWELLARHAEVADASVDVGSGRLAAVVDIQEAAQLRQLAADLSEVGGCVLDVHGPVELRRGFFALRPTDPRLVHIRAAFDPAGVLGWEL